ncbi:MAG: T9SS type A sorting domain-containing protein [Salibacteraceae bacterium]
MRYLYSFLFALSFLMCFTENLRAQGDTTIVEVLNYNASTRDTMAVFPNVQGETYEKIIMLYNMRCTDGLVSPPVAGQTNLGCGEWDYSCNTYIHDPDRIDSLARTTNSHTITAFTGTTYDYVTVPTYTYYQLDKKDVQATVVSETNHAVGTGSTALSHVVPTNIAATKSHYLFTAAELQSSGLGAGTIDALTLNVLTGGTANFFRIGLKATTKTVLDPADVDQSGFTEVYFNTAPMATGVNRFQFYTPFTWDGTSNVIVEFSNTNSSASGGTSATIEGGSVSPDYGLYANNSNYIIANAGQVIDMPVAPLSGISNEVTISFWSYGDEDQLPRNTTIFEGRNNSNQRQVNVHLPWNNSQIYWDAGNDGSGYDRINTTAGNNDFSGRWNHWAFVKNATTGSMQIYLNGNLWHSGNGRNKTMDIQDFKFLNNYYGKVNELRIWSKALSGTTISDWMSRKVDNTHPDYADLLAYYPFDNGSGSTEHDVSPSAASATISGSALWGFDRGRNMNRFFQATAERPNLTFYQGTYTLNVSNVTVLDSLPNAPNQVTEHQIVPLWGSAVDDSIANISVNNYWEAAAQPNLDENGTQVGTVPVTPSGTINVTQLPFFERDISKVEILSFVTPYGINLDLGMEGKTYAFDVTDFGPVLKGTKRFTMERGGQFQEEMDIKFMYITGTPPRDVLDIQQIWRVDSRNYTSIINDDSFEPRDVPTRADGKHFKVRSIITGHGQEGEFIPQQHYIDIYGGNDEYVRQVWTECSENPVYPQGGTWIYDRAGWCPGFPSDVAEYEITSMVTPGQTVNIDYGMYSATGTSRYIVNNQLVTYGDINHNLDAAIDDIIAPSKNVFHARLNPICDNAVVRIKNTGATVLTSAEIVYGVEGRDPQTVNWQGNLSFMETSEVHLPMNHEFNWNGSSATFTVRIQKPNGGADEYAQNDALSTTYEIPPTYPGEVVLWFSTNNAASESSYSVRNAVTGQVLYNRAGMMNSTLYRDTMSLPYGCYTLEVFDSDQDGIDFFANNDGTGSIRLRENGGPILENFDGDYGAGFKHNFTVGYTVDVPELNTEAVFKVFPNPSRGIFNFEIDGFDNQLLTLEVYSALGQLVHQKNVANPGHLMVETLHLEGLPAGVYIVKLNDGSAQKLLRIVKE